MKKLISSFIILFLISSLILPGISLATNLISITFPDSNLYNAIVKALDDKIANKNDKKQTIEMIQEDIDSVQELYSLNSCQIEDLTGLESFKNLTFLHLYSNQISDITPLASLHNLELLTLHMNNISDITPLSSLHNLSTLFLDYNNISDITPLSKLNNLSVISLQNQNVTKKVSFETELPSLFTESQNPNSKAFSNGPLEFENCYLDENSTTLHINQGITYAKVTVKGDDGAFNSVLNLEVDQQAPELTIEYSPQELTKEDVTVTVKSNEQVCGIDGWTLNEEQTLLTKVFKQNTTEKFDIKDLTGNSVSVTIKVENIDKQAPNLTVNYSQQNPTKEDVQVSIVSDEEIQALSGWNLSQDKKTLTKTYRENAKETIAVYDLVGNKTEETIIVNNIDKEVPTAKVSYSTTTPTEGSVTVTIQTSEPVQGVSGWSQSEDGMTLTKVFTENRQESIHIKDLAGNTLSVQVKVENIFSPTEAELNIESITYSTKEMTNENVTVTIKANKKLQKVDGWNLDQTETVLTKTFEKNTQETIIVKDTVGNTKEVSISVNNIDKQAPTGKAEYSKTQPTRGSITVTITADEVVQKIDGWSLDTTGKILTKVFDKNSNETVTLKDTVGNTSTVSVQVTNIDKEAPNVTIEYSTKDQTKEDITVTIKSNEPLQEVEGWILSEDKMSLTKVYFQNKEEEFNVKDIAGNETKVSIKVANMVESPNDNNNSQTPIVPDNNNGSGSLGNTAQKDYPNAGKITLIISILTILGIISISYSKYRKYKYLSNLK